MIKILLISASFPPDPSVGGLRPAYFFKFFNESNLDTHVFTINHDSYNNLMSIDFDKSIHDKVRYLNYSEKDEIEYIKNRDLRKKIRDFFNPSNSSPPGLLDAAKKKIQEEFDIPDFDLIIATVPDMWTASLGSYLSKKYNVKFIIDFRDAYEQEAGMPRSFRQHIQLLRLLYARRKFVKDSFELITVSKYLAAELERKFRKKTSVIYNGYDEAIFHSDSFERNQLNEKGDSKINIVYVGKILNLWYRNPLPLIRAMRNLNGKGGINREIELHFYAVEEDILSSFVNKKDLEYIFFHERVNYNKVKEVLKEADLLLVLTNIGRKGILTTKLYEYMPVNKPVICLPNDDEELKEIIEEYGLGFNLENEEQIIDFFRNYVDNMNSYENNSYLREDVAFFTRERQSKILAEHIKQILN